MNKTTLANSLIILLLILINSCKESANGGSISEGTIIYNIEYPSDRNSSSLVSMMPDEMKISFKGNNTVMDIEGNIFHVKYITNIKQNKIYSLVDIVFNTYIMESDTSEPIFGFSQIKDIQYEYTKDTTTICGYHCKNAIAHAIIGNTKHDFTLWYTNDIKIKNPNTSNPFKKIDGVLLKFEVIMSDIYMSMCAKEVIKESIPDETFEVPSGCKPIDKRKLEDMIKSFSM
ncbi:MAG: hypothetical protein IKQ46_16180 [Bacteroidales bacterium]|nr:hypothetical protein [Bacteroidales bacterium]